MKARDDGPTRLCLWWAGRHTVYLASPKARFRVCGGWDAAQEEFAERMIDTGGGAGAGPSLHHRGARALSGRSTPVPACSSAGPAPPVGASPVPLAALQPRRS